MPTTYFFYRIKPHFLYGLIVGLYMILCGVSAMAQTPKTLPPDTAGIGSQKNRLDQLAKKDSIIRRHYIYDSIQNRLGKRKWLRKLYGLVFRNPQSIKIGDPPKKIKDQFRKLNGRIVRNIIIRRLPVFGPRVNDTLRKPNNRIERFANRLHRNTREFVLRNNLLFYPGQIFNSVRLGDNERLLRESNYLLDARLIPVLVGKDSVDIVAICQDVWSLSADGALGSAVAGNFRIGERNFLGFGHELRTGFTYDFDRDSPAAFQADYLVPYIGKTFVTGRLRVAQVWESAETVMELQRNFLRPSDKYAGGLELARRRQLGPNYLSDTTLAVNYTYLGFDGWFGRAIPFWFGTESFKERTRLVVSGRLMGNRFVDRPLIRSDTNKIYQNRAGLQMAVGFSDRTYYRDVLIYGFGRTEDVPEGSLAALIFGPEITEFGYRTYIEGKFATGSYLDNIGYLYTNLQIGNYINSQNKIEQGLVSGQVLYFSPLQTVIKNHYVRHFVRLGLTSGYRRFVGEGIELNGGSGIRGISFPQATGLTRLFVNMETTFFAPKDIFGFRIAAFGFADLGMIGGLGRSVWASRLWQGYGFGLRLRNENLALNTLQIRIGWYPQATTNPLRPTFSGIQNLTLPDFDINKPENTRFQ